MPNRAKIGGISDNHQDSIVGLFRDRPDVKIFLFGSRAKGNYREGSDIDLALKGDKLTTNNINQWLEAYEALFLPWKLDLVLYDHIEEPKLREHIDRVGIRLN